MIGIYKITNIINKKVYIGQSKNIEKRFSKHKKYTQNEHLKNAFSKYGIYNFSFEILFKLENNSDNIRKILDEKEKEFISLYEATNREKGYNIQSGGFIGCSHSEETKKKLREKTNGKTYEEIYGEKKAKEIKEKMRNSRKGYKLSSETKEKIGRSNSSRYSKPILLVETGEVFNNTIEISIVYGLNRKSIRSAITGGKRLWGLSFSYNLNIKNEKIISRDEAKKLLETNKMNLKNNKINLKKVICVTTEEIFNSAEDAAFHFNIDKQKIYEICIGRRKQINGLVFEYFGDKE